MAWISAAFCAQLGKDVCFCYLLVMVIVLMFKLDILFFLPCKNKKKKQKKRQDKQRCKKKKKNRLRERRSKKISQAYLPHWEFLFFFFLFSCFFPCCHFRQKVLSRQKSDKRLKNKKQYRLGMFQIKIFYVFFIHNIWHKTGISSS